MYRKDVIRGLKRRKFNNQEFVKEKLLIKLILFRQDKVEKIIIIIIIKVKLILFGQDKVEKKNEDGKIAKDSRFN